MRACACVRSRARVCARGKWDTWSKWDTSGKINALACPTTGAKWDANRDTSTLSTMIASLVNPPATAIDGHLDSCPPHRFKCSRNAVLRGLVPTAALNMQHFGKDFLDRDVIAPLYVTLDRVLPGVLLESVLLLGSCLRQHVLLGDPPSLASGEEFGRFRKQLVTVARKSLDVDRAASDRQEPPVASGVQSVAVVVDGADKDALPWRLDRTGTIRWSKSISSP